MRRREMAAGAAAGAAERAPVQTNVDALVAPHFALARPACAGCASPALMIVCNRAYVCSNVCDRRPHSAARPGVRPDSKGDKQLDRDLEQFIRALEVETTLPVPSHPDAAITMERPPSASATFARRQSGRSGRLRRCHTRCRASACAQLYRTDAPEIPVGADGRRREREHS
jgi:hypothetical protein